MKSALAGQADKDKMLRLAGVNLTDDERLIAAARIHDGIYWKPVAVCLTGILMLLNSILMKLGFFVIFVGLVMIGLAYLTQNLLKLAATNKRLFIRSGILYADMVELRYTQVESVELGITPIGQIFGYGSVIVTGTGQRRVIVPFVADAIGFRSKVNDILVNK